MNGRDRRGDRRPPQDRLRINHRIRVPEIRVIGDDGEQLGVIATYEALRLAEEKGLDLVEISPRAFPPVCRIMDYGKYKYEQAKKKQQARKHASTVEIKEIKFRPKTEGHDMDFKVKHVRRFLEEGNKVRLVIVFRGREITHPQTGLNVLNRVVDATADICGVEVSPNMEGRRMVLILAPKSGVIRKAAEARKAAITAQLAAKAQEKHSKRDGDTEAPDDDDEYHEDVEEDDDDDLEGDDGAADEGGDSAS
ncbi:MAG: translation initiation factor IF-3 [Myxococcales bacterium]|nr:translation initiation factor IF-3 [Myxococcales bacterium]